MLLFRNLEKVEQPVVYQVLARRYTEHAGEFIRSAGKQPFFLYHAHNMPHIPVGTSERAATATWWRGARLERRRGAANIKGERP